MAAGAVVADQGAGGKRILRRGKRLFLGEGNWCEHAGLKPVRWLPRRSPRLKQHIVLVVLEVREERLPVGPHGIWRLLVTCIELREIGGVGALQKRRGGKHVVQFVPRHGITLPVVSRYRPAGQKR